VAGGHEAGDRIWDVVIVGGGHNGLTAAAYLARSGLSVLVAEKNDVVGGAAVTEEFHPGFRNSVASYTVSLLSPKVIADLRLKEYGLKLIERPVANFWPIDDRRHLLFSYDGAQRHAAVAAFSSRDADRLEAFERFLETGAGVLRDLVLRAPPNAGGGLSSILAALSQSRRFLSLSQSEKADVVDLFTRSAADILSRWFESDIVCAAFAFDSVVGAYQSPSQPGSAYVLLHHVFGEVNGKAGRWGHAVGGMGAITQAMAASARAAGASIETGLRITRIEIDEGRASGVSCADGRRFKARAVACALPPKLVFERLIEADDLPERASAPAERLRRLRSGSGTFRMNVALSELPDFTCLPGREPSAHHGAGIIIGPGMDYLEAAFSDARREGWSREPVIEMLIPSVIDDTLAPAGQHVASLFVQHVAPKLPEGRSWGNPAEKEAFADHVLATVDRYAPNFSKAVIGRQVLSPLDLENRFGLIDGDIFHGQLGLDQLYVLRPVFGHADYRLPVPGLYLCASGAHPGGGVTGAPGHNAAGVISRDLKGWWRSN